MELRIVQYFQNNATPFWDVVMKLITLMGGAFFLVFVFLVFYYAFNKDYALNFIIATTLVSLFNYVVKSWIKRPRPYIESTSITQKSYSSNYSFASGHSVCSSSIAAGVIYYNRKNQKNLWWICLLCVLGALLVGFSRIYLGHHYLTDVLAGLFLGGFLVPYIISLLSKFKWQKWFSLILGVAGFVGVFLFVEHFFVITSRINTFRACGGVCGLGFGMFLEYKFVKFDVKTVKNKKNIFWICPLAILDVAVLFYLLNLIPQFGIVTFVCLFIVGFFATFVQMLLMKKIYAKLDAR